MQSKCYECANINLNKYSFLTSKVLTLAIVPKSFNQKLKLNKTVSSKLILGIF